MENKKILPRVSIITVTFNLIQAEREDFFRQCIKSVHNQTYSNIEHLIIDGASTDGTLEIIKEYDDKLWVKYYSEPDTGMWNAMNKGIRKATGKYIAILNSDDFYTSDDVIKTAIEELESSQSDYLYGNAQILNRETSTVLIDNCVDIKENFFLRMPYNHQSLICKKSVYEILNGYNEKYKTTIDYEFVIKLIFNDYKSVYINKNIVSTRLGGTTTDQTGKHSATTLQTVSLLFQDMYAQMNYPLTNKEALNIFLYSYFPDNSLKTLKTYLVQKKLQNFNYEVFFKEIGKILLMNKKKFPKVTVVTPTFNLIENDRKAFFRQCVTSIYTQTYPNIEHLIIDGASTDGTLELIKEYEDKNWIKCYSEPDEGMCDAMNKGIKKASGKYIAILNSDDFYTKDAIGLSISRILEVNADYSCAGTNMLYRETLKLYTIWSPSIHSFFTFFHAMPYNHETMLCKKDIYEKLGYYNYKKYATIADYRFVIDLILHDYKPVILSEIILNFRMDGTTNILDKESTSATLAHTEYLQIAYKNLWEEFIPKKYYSKIEEIFSQQNRKYLNLNSIHKLYEDWFQLPLQKFILEKQLIHFPYYFFSKTYPRQIFLFHKILIFKIKQTYNKSEYRLFNILPLITIKKNTTHTKTSYKLFSILPLLKIKIIFNNTSYYLLSLIPFLKITENKNTTCYNVFGVPFFELRK